MLASVDPIIIQSKYAQDYRHRLTYIVYLSKKIEHMRYAKNCDEFFIENINTFNDINVFKKQYWYESLNDVNQPID